MTTHVRTISAFAAFCCGGSMASSTKNQQPDMDFMHTRVSPEHQEAAGTQRPRFPSTSSAAAAVLGARPGKPLFPWHLESFKRSEESASALEEEYDDDDDIGDEDDDGHVVGYSATELNMQAHVSPIPMIKSHQGRFTAALKRGYKLSESIIQYVSAVDNPKSTICDVASYSRLLQIRELYHAPDKAYDQSSEMEIDDQDGDFDQDDELLGGGSGNSGSSSALEELEDAGKFLFSDKSEERKQQEKHDKKLRGGSATRKEGAKFDEHELAKDRLHGQDDDERRASLKTQGNTDGNEHLGRKSIFSAPSLKCRAARPDELASPMSDAAGNAEPTEEDLSKSRDKERKAKAALDAHKAKMKRKHELSDDQARSSKDIAGSRKRARKAETARSKANSAELEVVEERRLDDDDNDADDLDETEDLLEPHSSELELTSGVELSVDASGEMEMELDSSMFESAEAHLESVSVLEGGTEAGANSQVRQMVCTWKQGSDSANDDHAGEDPDEMDREDRESLTKFDFTVFVVSEKTSTEDGLDIETVMMRLVEGVDIHEYQMAPRHQHGKDNAHFGQCNRQTQHPWHSSLCGKDWSMDNEHRRHDAQSTRGFPANMFRSTVKTGANDLDELWRFRYVEIVYNEQGAIAMDGFTVQTDFGDLTDSGSIKKPFSWLQVGPGQQIPCIVNKGRDEHFMPMLGKRNELSSPDYRLIENALRKEFHHKRRHMGWMYPSHGWNIAHVGPRFHLHDAKCSWKTMHKHSSPDKMGKKTKWRCRIHEWNGKEGKAVKKKQKKQKAKEIEPETDVKAPSAPKEQKGGSSCLAQSSLLHTPQGLVQAGSLKVGDFLVGPGGVPEPVITFLHYHVDDEATTFTSITVSDSLAPLRLSADHIIFLADGRSVPASKLQVGDRLANREGSGSSVVTNIGAVVETGFVAPLTPSGIIFSQDGVVLSCYAGEDMPHALAHAVLSPLRATYTIFPFAAQGYLANSTVASNSTAAFATPLISH